LLSVNFVYQITQKLRESGWWNFWRSTAWT